MPLSTRDRNNNHKQGEHDDEDDFLPNPVKKPSSNSKPVKRNESTSDLGSGSFESGEVHDTSQTRKSSVANGQTRNKESSQPQKKERSKSRENMHQTQNRNQDGEAKKSNSGSGTNGTGRSRRSIVDREEEELKLALELSLKEASGIAVGQKEGTVNNRVTEAAKRSGNLDDSTTEIDTEGFDSQESVTARDVNEDTEEIVISSSAAEVREQEVPPSKKQSPDVIVEISSKKKESKKPRKRKSFLDDDDDGSDFEADGGYSDDSDFDAPKKSKKVKKPKKSKTAETKPKEKKSSTKPKLGPTTNSTAVSKSKQSLSSVNAEPKSIASAIPDSFVSERIENALIPNQSKTNEPEIETTLPDSSKSGSEPKENDSRAQKANKADLPSSTNKIPIRSKPAVKHPSPLSDRTSTAQAVKPKLHKSISRIPSTSSSLSSSVSPASSSLAAQSHDNLTRNTAVKINSSGAVPIRRVGLSRLSRPTKSLHPYLHK